MISRADGATEVSPFLTRWDVGRLKQRLVVPSNSDTNPGSNPGSSMGSSMGSKEVEGVTVLPEVLPPDCCRGRAQTPWGMSYLVWNSKSVFQWEFEETSLDPRPGPWLDHRIPSNDLGAQEWVDDWVGHWVAGIKNPVTRVSVSVSGTPSSERFGARCLRFPRIIDFIRPSGHGRRCSRSRSSGGSRLSSQSGGSSGSVPPSHSRIRGIERLPLGNGS